MRLNPSLLALAAGAFGIGVTEFAPMGMLPSIAADLHISIPVAGLLVSAYAIGVVIGAPLMTLTTGRVDRRTLLIALMGIFTLGNLLSALASGYWMLMAARIVTSFNHGAFFGVGSVVAASLVAPDKRAGAVAAMFTGLTIATIGGVPLATWAGEVLGWRTAFAGIAGVGVVAMLSLRLALPSLPAVEGGDMRAELGVLTRRPVLLARMVSLHKVAWISAVRPARMPCCDRQNGRDGTRTPSPAQRRPFRHQPATLPDSPIRPRSRHRPAPRRSRCRG